MSELSGGGRESGVPAGWEAVIGLEVHVELATASKMFCPCPTRFGAPPNGQVCPVCLGLPGVLPVPNRQAVELAVKAALALNCRVATYSKFDRKNYFYPDMPKNYQISQYDLPLAGDGYLEIPAAEGSRKIRIRRLHLEEDTGKSMHAADDIVTARYSLVDFNRAGIPLAEIVSEPDLSTPEEARLYLEKLKAIMQYCGVSDCRMEEGSLRCDINVSVRRPGERAGTRTEVKNVNSFRAVERALAYEIWRQVQLLEAGGEVEQETRHWDEGAGRTRTLRTKEYAHDYRYFPDPDLPPLVLDPTWIEEVRRSLPELPDARRERYVRELGLPPYDAAVITASRGLAEFFEEAVSAYPQPKAVSNWVMGEVRRYLNEHGLEPEDIPVRPGHLAELLRMVERGTINTRVAKQVFGVMCETGRPAAEIVREKGLEQVSDEAFIDRAVEEAVAGNPAVVADYRKGKEKALGFLVGQVMKATRGKANPQMVNRLLRDRLGPPGPA
ncbi:MAG: Asp-tRNA(Asn)/Glu-tRNA(Gln) amidotransferase subunit GatB [Bacillota bacterium]|nr:Asp-tRNA(Asn)/Glu-tRNA(Gln) amidotransferase subunit GatB [Bacillota bacterium]